MDATPTAPLIVRHVWRASDGGSGGCAFICPYLHSRRKPSGAGLSVSSIVNFERTVDDHREAARPQRRYLGARVRAASRYRATPPQGT
jgi:hypothetical protein